MGKVTGFLDTARVEPAERPVAVRVRDHREVGVRLPIVEVRAQAGRCMDCGVPFCHTAQGEGGGCPLGNVIPEFNDRVYRGDWEGASRTLAETNNLPEVTGRVCPAPCERACVLDLHGAPVTIESIERAIADAEFERHGAFVPRPATVRTGRRVAVVGSGPAGLAAAQQLARAGHDVEVVERADRAGGLLRYGIPDFKLEKHWIDRRLAQMEAEGVVFRTGLTLAAADGPGAVSLATLRSRFDAVVLATGATVPRDLDVPGRSLAGVHVAMTYLDASNRAVATGSPAALDAKGLRVVVIGGGDTGSDCVGTAVRQGAARVVNLEVRPSPPETRSASTPWPAWPLELRTSSSHDEAAHVWGGDVRRWALETLRFVGEGRVEGVAVRPVGGGEVTVIEADLVLLALGFVGPEPAALAGLERDARGLVATTAWATSVQGVFACGDARRGQSLVVWALAEGRACAAAVDAALR